MRSPRDRRVVSSARGRSSPDRGHAPIAAIGRPRTPGAHPRRGARLPARGRVREPLDPAGRRQRRSRSARSTTTSAASSGSSWRCSRPRTPGCSSDSADVRRARAAVGHWDTACDFLDGTSVIRILDVQHRGRRGRRRIGKHRGRYRLPARSARPGLPAGTCGFTAAERMCSGGQQPLLLDSSAHGPDAVPWPRATGRAPDLGTRSRSLTARQSGPAGSRTTWLRADLS